MLTDKITLVLFMISIENNNNNNNKKNKNLTKKLKEVLNEVRENDKIRVAILRSQIPGIFCAGADLKVKIFSS
jgi:enoyl-CoA hydratase/carnithine racemase